MPVNPHVLQIGAVRMETPVALAPMAGYTDLPFRMNTRAITPHAFLAYSEMVEPHSILRGGGKKRDALLAAAAADAPLAWQIYGVDPDLMAAAAQWLAERRGALMIDINMGCPKRKIARRGAGAGLLLDHALALEIARRVAAAVRVPVTAKLRLGWEDNDNIALRLAPELEQAGIAAITIHGRTGAQGYAGTADRAAIGHVVSAVRCIPVIANGDIRSAQDALDMRNTTGCAGVMIGRAALHNPWLIGECAAALAGAPAPTPPDRAEQRRFLQNHFRGMAAQHGEKTAVLMFRRWIPQYARMLRIPREPMLELLRTRTIAELRAGLRALDIDQP